MKYNLPSVERHKVRVGALELGCWIVDGHIAIDADEDGFLKRLVVSRVLYDGARSVRHAYERFKALKDLLAIDKERRKRIMEGCGDLGADLFKAVEDWGETPYEARFNPVLDQLS